MDIKKVGDNIKKLRELKNISREWLAEKAEMSLSGYSKLERGEVDLTLTRVQKISEALGVSVSQVLNFDATQIFNISNNQNVQGVNNTQIYHDEYKDKYIAKLEEEIDRLKSRQK